MKKMKCTEVSLKLSPYQDNELGEETRAAVEEHLFLCSHCRKELESLERIAADISSLEEIGPLLNFNASVMSSVKEHEERRYSGKLGFVYSFVFTLFFIVGILIEPFSHSTPPKPEMGRELSSVLLDGQKFTSGDLQNSVVLQLVGREK